MPTYTWKILRTDHLQNAQLISWVRKLGLEIASPLSILIDTKNRNTNLKGYHKWNQWTYLVMSYAPTRQIRRSLGRLLMLVFTSYCGVWLLLRWYKAVSFIKDLSKSFFSFWSFFLLQVCKLMSYIMGVSWTSSSAILFDPWRWISCSFWVCLCQLAVCLASFPRSFCFFCLFLFSLFLVCDLGVTRHLTLIVLRHMSRPLQTAEEGLYIVLSSLLLICFSYVFNLFFLGSCFISRTQPHSNHTATHGAMSKRSSLLFVDLSMCYLIS